MITALPFTPPSATPATRTRGEADTSGRNRVAVGRDKNNSQRVLVPVALARSVQATLGQAINLLMAIVERGGNSRHRIISAWAPAKEGTRARYGGIGRREEVEAAGHGYTYLYPEFQFDGEPVYLSGEGSEFVCGDRSISGVDLLDACWLNGYNFVNDDGDRVYVNGLDSFIGVVNASLPGLGLAVTASGTEITMSFDKEFRKGPGHLIERASGLEKMLAPDAHPSVKQAIADILNLLVVKKNAEAAEVIASATPADDSDETEPSER